MFRFPAGTFAIVNVALDVADGEIRVRDDADPGRHPAVDIAANPQHLFVLEHDVALHALRWAPEIECIALGGVAVDVVHQVVDCSSRAASGPRERQPRAACRSRPPDRFRPAAMGRASPGTSLRASRRHSRARCCRRRAYISLIGRLPAFAVAHIGSIPMRMTRLPGSLPVKVMRPLTVPPAAPCADAAGAWNRTAAASAAAHAANVKSLTTSFARTRFSGCPACWAGTSTSGDIARRPRQSSRQRQTARRRPSCRSPRAPSSRRHASRVRT